MHSSLRVLGATWALVALGGPEAVRAAPATSAPAQGLTTASVRGTLRISDGSDPAGARVTVRNHSTGFVVEAEVRNGRFLIQGLEVGGPYSVTVRRIGARAERREVGFLSLGDPYLLDVLLEPAPVQLDSLVSLPAPASRFSHSNVHGGTATTIADSLIHHLPSLNRDIYDFVRLVPQISTRVGLPAGGMSGGGVGMRLNHFQADGVSQRSLLGGQPHEFAGGKSLPFEAVREYQVLLAPFDIRYGDFAGAAINAVTRSGTNRVRGSSFAQFRSDALSRNDTLPYDRTVYGASLSGPLARDRAHFLVAAEFQRLTSPMAGPYVGQPASATPPVPVRVEDLSRLGTILRRYGLEAGSGGAVLNRNPLRNAFLRLDAALPEVTSRVVLWFNDTDAETLDFGRGARDAPFPLSSHATTFESATRTGALQVHTALARRGGGHNELFLSRRSTRANSAPEVLQPVITVALPGVSGGVIPVISGTPQQAQSRGVRNHNVNLRDNLTLPLGGSHVATIGLEAEWFRLEPAGVAGSFGSWSFLSLDSLEAGVAERFEATRDFGAGNASLKGAQYALVAGDQWRLGETVSLTLGVRADLLDLRGRPPYHPGVDSVFGRRTDRMPAAHVHLSPRIGFTWRTGGAGRNQVRGGLGVFTGRPPLAWLQMPLLAYGLGTGLLRCGSLPGDQGPPPAFDPDRLSPPTTCAGESGTTPSGDVELVDPRLRMARTLRGVLAWDRELPGGFVATAEALLTWNLSDFIFVNLNLAGPQSTDSRGRVLYGTIAASGVATPALRDASLPGVIDLQNVRTNRSTQLSARLEKRFSGGASAMAAYTWSRVRDVQTPIRVNMRGAVNWSSRAVSGRHDDLRTGISLNDLPHRVILAGSWRAPWRRWTTELAFLYVGESGSPFTYRTAGSRGLGDLNADGSNLNDPIYVPRDAHDSDEIAFTGISADPNADPSPPAQAARVLAQQNAFERFIEDMPCLRQQRGRILARNSCREPWSHTSALSLRQRIPVRAHGIELQLDLFNVLNLLNDGWGIRRISQSALLTHVGQLAGPGGAPQPVFRFQETASPWLTDPAESAFQIQFGLAYLF
jgi:hypothetical protein